MPRGRKRSLKFKLKTDTFRSVVGIALIFFTALSYVAFVLPDYSLNATISGAYRRFFGYGGYLVPLFLLWGGLLLVGFRWRFLQARIVIGLAAVSIAITALLHVFYSGKEAQKIAMAGRGGGLIGYRLARGLSGAISVYGAFFVFAFMLLAGILLLSDVSIERVISFVNKMIDKLKAAKFPGLSFKFPFGHKDPGAANLPSSVTEADAVVINEEAKSNTPRPESPVEILPLPAEPLAGSMNGSGLGLEKNQSHLTTLVSEGRESNSLPYTNKVWEYPPRELLVEAPSVSFDTNEVKRRQKTIEETLKSFGVRVDQAGYNVGPTVTQYAYSVPPGTRIAKISNLQVDLAMALESPTGSVRLEIPIPGRNAIGVEVPNLIKSFVYFKDILQSDAMKAMKSKIAIGLGKDVAGAVRAHDIAKMPHMLVAGATGSGKSVFLHSIMFSILYRASPQEVKFILIDPKRVELLNYNGIPHLITPVITDMDKAPSAFRWAANEMMRRYKLFEAARARNIDAYNEKSGFQALPHIIIMVDELADIMVVDPSSVERSIVRLSQLSRATGIHMILTVQRPSTDILTGVIKANIPCRAAFNVTSQVDSRVIIDQAGAEKLVGRGDMLFVPPDASKPVRIQGCWISDGEISKLVDWLKNTGFTPDYKDEVHDTPDEEKKSGSSV
ncbi:DNA translocase FtsK 4TM domain-containing protein, partial [Patescibacteria group bacterium]|nr:DNA translocase FtsK 4TM domain-containing protein [Patescibacteria group bacterium]